MHCPRCGNEVQKADRFCVECGADLHSRAGEGSVSLRERIARLVGTDRRTRLLTAGTAGALVVAIGAFVALDPSPEDEVPRDAYTIAADEACVDAKQAIAAAGRDTLDADASGSLVDYAGTLLRNAAQWRLTMRSLDPPSDRVARAQELDEALREVLVEAAALAGVARKGGAARLQEQAARVDATAGRVQAAIEELGMDECARLRLAPAAQRG